MTAPTVWQVLVLALVGWGTIVAAPFLLLLALIVLAVVFGLVLRLIDLFYSIIRRLRRYVRRTSVVSQSSCRCYNSENDQWRAGTRCCACGSFYLLQRLQDPQVCPCGHIREESTGAT